MNTTFMPIDGRVNFGVKRPLIFPMPCFMIGTYDEHDIPNILLVSYCCQIYYDKVILFLNPHKTTDNILLKRAFTISYATKSTMVESDYLGIVSGKKIIDKVRKAGLSVTRSPNVDAPIINEYPLTLECNAIKITLDGEDNIQVIGQIVNMSAKENIVNAKGKIDIEKLQPIIYDSSDNTYRVVGEIVGKAFQVGKALLENPK